MSFGVDLRGFTYKLDSIQNQAKWKLDLLEIELTKARQEAQQSEQLIEQMKLREQEHSNFVRISWQNNMDVSVHKSSLGFLLKLKTEIRVKQKELKELQNKCDSICHECIELQQKIELFDSHRQECLSEYLLEQLRQQNAEIDRDWNARSIWRTKKRVANV